MNYIQGDLLAMALNGDFDAIVHGCNCFHTMGGGIAAQVRRQFPEAYQADLKTRLGDKRKVGTYSFAKLDNGVVIINAYTQYDMSSGEDVFEYEGFQKILNQLKELREHGLETFGFPLIGCGLAGGNKDRIMKMIEDTLGDRATIVEFG